MDLTGPGDIERAVRDVGDAPKEQKEHLRVLFEEYWDGHAVAPGDGRTNSGSR